MNLGLIESVVQLIELGCVADEQDIIKNLNSAIKQTKEQEVKPLADKDLPILGILQKAYSVPLGCPIWETDDEYEKLKKIVITAIRVTEERYGVK